MPPPDESIKRLRVYVKRSRFSIDRGCGKDFGRLLKAPSVSVADDADGARGSRWHAARGATSGYRGGKPRVCAARSAVWALLDDHSCARRRRGTAAPSAWLWLPCSRPRLGPAGYGGERSVASTSLGRAFARLAQLESVSIPAFGRLADELARLGLSPDLSARAKQAQRDEVRHARDTWELARRFGASPTRLEKMPRERRERSLIDLALENVEEGCVREAYGSVVAAHQAESAVDPEVRRVMTTIARDEAAHAELAWAIHDELMAKLCESERALVATAFDEAWAALGRDVERAENDHVLRALAGLPDSAAALAGLRALEGAVRERLAEAA